MQCKQPTYKWYSSYAGATCCAMWEIFGSGLVSKYPLCLHEHVGKVYARIRPSKPGHLPDRGKSKPMTIAAGFVHREGVLLCADTELTAGDRKLHASKIFHFDCALGRFAFVFAGHVHNAIATLQKIEAAVTKARRNPMGVVEHTLDREYKRLVLCQPVQFHDAFDFSLIIAFRPPKGGVEMYFTDAAAIRREQFHATVGIGAVFAEQLIDATANVGPSSRGGYLTLAAYVLGSVKKRITNCGGASLYIDVGDNGSLTELYGDDYLKAIEEWFGVYQMLTWELFTQLADGSMSDDDFAKNFATFHRHMIEQRQKWKDLKARHIQISEAYQIISRSKAKPDRPKTKHGR
jgi:hypothetical protein